MRQQLTIHTILPEVASEVILLTSHVLLPFVSNGMMETCQLSAQGLYGKLDEYADGLAIIHFQLLSNDVKHCIHLHRLRQNIRVSSHEHAMVGCNAHKAI